MTTSIGQAVLKTYGCPSGERARGYRCGAPAGSGRYAPERNGTGSRDTSMGPGRDDTTGISRSYVVTYWIDISAATPRNLLRSATGGRLELRLGPTEPCKTPSGLQIDDCRARAIGVSYSLLRSGRPLLSVTAAQMGACGIEDGAKLVPAFVACVSCFHCPRGGLRIMVSDVVSTCARSARHQLT